MSSEMLPPMDHAHRGNWEVPRAYAAAGLTSTLSPLLSASPGYIVSCWNGATTCGRL